jgi:hypothetical protein
VEVLKLKNGEGRPDNFTGIVEYPGGTKSWFKDGLYHREDGPACEYSNGIKCWYKNGKRHRLDGPAVEWVNGEKQWYLEGQFFSEKVWKEKVEKLKESKVETLKVKSTSEVPKNFTGIVEYPNGDKSWYKEGRRHREDGPAIEYQDGHKEWWVEGTLLRKEPSHVGTIEMNTNKITHQEQINSVYIDDPSLINGIDWLKWTKDNKYTGTAVASNGATHWFKDGKRHREDGPASMFPEGVEYYLNGIGRTKEEFMKLTQRKQENGNPKGTSVSNPKETENLDVAEKPTFITQAKVDLRQAGIRIACRKSVSVVKETLINLLSLGKTNKETKSIRAGITSLFESEYGKGLIGYLMGQLLPIVKEKFPEKYQPVMEELATEFRVEGIAVAGGEALTALGGLLTLAKGGLMESMNSLLEDTTEKIRILDDKETLNELNANKNIKEEELIEVSKNKKEEKTK